MLTETAETAGQIKTNIKLAIQRGHGAVLGSTVPTGHHVEASSKFGVEPAAITPGSLIIQILGG